MRPLPALLLLTVLATSCSHANDKAKLLPDALEEFNASLAWRNVHTAAYFVAPETAERTLPHLRKQLEELHIVGVEPLETRILVPGKRALITVRVLWHEKDSLTVKKGIETQEWVERDGRWWLLEQRAPKTGESDPSPFVIVEPEPPDNEVKP